MNEATCFFFTPPYRIFSMLINKAIIYQETIASCQFKAWWNELYLLHGPRNSIGLIQLKENFKTN